MSKNNTLWIFDVTCPVDIKTLNKNLFKKNTQQKQTNATQQKRKKTAETIKTQQKRLNTNFLFLRPRSLKKYVKHKNWRYKKKLHEKRGRPPRVHTLHALLSAPCGLILLGRQKPWAWPTMQKALLQTNVGNVFQEDANMSSSIRLFFKFN